VIEPKHDNILWRRSGYFLSRDAQQRATLICFGASASLEQRLNALPIESWQEIFEDPFNLLAVILSDLHLQLDEELWALNSSVGGVEHVCVPLSVAGDSVS
jgi:hypothetical protein